MRRSSSRAIRTCAICSARASRPATRSCQQRVNQCARRDLELGPEVVQAPAQVVDQRRALRRRAARGDRPAAARRARARPAGRPAACRALRGSRRARSRRHRSHRTCRARATDFRAPAISFGGTRTTRSPRASRKRSSAPETCRQSSIAHTRSRAERRAPTRSRSSNERRLALTVALGDLAARALVDRRDGVRHLVRVRPEHDHLHRPFVGIPDERIAGGHISVGAMPRSYQVTPEILGRRRATQPPTVRLTADTRLTSQPAAEPRTYRPRRTPPRRPGPLSH